MQRENPGDRSPRRRVPWARAVAALVFLAATAAPPGAAESSPAGTGRLAPGEPILNAAVDARAVLAGVLDEPRRLDAKSYAATLRVDRVVAGGAVTSQLIAWEEPTAARAPRLAPGDRILVALDDLPRSSLWQSRLPAGEALLVAAAGNAFARDPSAAALDAVAAFLEIPPPDRNGAAGDIALANLLAQPDPVLAAAALRRLRTSSAPLPDAAVAAVERTLADGARPPDLRSGILGLVAERRAVALRPTVERLAAAPSDVAAVAIDTLGQLDGGLPDETVNALLDSDDPERRAVGARFVGAALAERRLPELSRSDPDARVRAAAAGALVATNTSWGLAAGIDALADREPAVRSAAAHAIARLGPVALPALDQCIALANPSAPGAIATLALMGPSASSRLAAIAETHGDHRLRELALLGLGRVRDEHSQ